MSAKICDNTRKTAHAFALIRARPLHGPLMNCHLSQASQPRPLPYAQPTPYAPQPTPYAQPDDYSARYAPAFSSTASSEGSYDFDFDALTVRMQKLNSTVGE